MKNEKMKISSTVVILSLVLMILLASCTSGIKKGIDKASSDSKKQISSIERIYNLDPQRKYIGDQVEDYHFIDMISNSEIHIDEVYKDKVTIIQSFSNGCPACVRGIADYNVLYDKYSDEIEIIYLDIQPDHPYQT